MMTAESATSTAPAVHWLSMSGMAVKEIVEAMTRQATAAAYVHALMFTSEPLESYAAELAESCTVARARVSTS